MVTDHAGGTGADEDGEGHAPAESCSDRRLALRWWQWRQQTLLAQVCLHPVGEAPQLADEFEAFVFIPFW